MADTPCHGWSRRIKRLFGDFFAACNACDKPGEHSVTAPSRNNRFHGPLAGPAIGSVSILESRSSHRQRTTTRSVSTGVVYYQSPEIDVSNSFWYIPVAESDVAHASERLKCQTHINVE